MNQSRDITEHMKGKMSIWQQLWWPKWTFSE